MDHTKLRQQPKPYIKNINYTERMLDAIEKRKREIPLNIFRKKVTDRQNTMNYQHEYVNKRDHLNTHSILDAHTHEYLTTRKA